MSGRPRLLMEQIDLLLGDEGQKERLKLIFATMVGHLSVTDACEQLGLCESRYYALRRVVLNAALQALSPQPAGRPRSTPVSPEVEQLLDRQLEQERELYHMRVREELLLALPRVLRERERPGQSGEKKGSRRTRYRLVRGRRAQ